MKPQRRAEQVLLVAVGAVAPKHLAEAGQGLAAVLGVSSRSGPSLDRPEYAFNAQRRQYHAPAVIRRLASLRPRAGGGPVVGITDVDLFLPDAPHVIGEADRDAGAAVFSLARLGSQDPLVLAHRVRAEAVHAAGHLLGLSQCSDARCAMFPSHVASDADRKGPGLCSSCRTALGL